MVRDKLGEGLATVWLGKALAKPRPRRGKASAKAWTMLGKDLAKTRQRLGRGLAKDWQMNGNNLAKVSQQRLGNARQSVGNNLAIICPTVAKALPHLCQAFSQPLPSLSQTFAKPLPNLRLACPKPLPSLYQTSGTFAKYPPSNYQAFAKHLPRRLPSIGKAVCQAKALPNIFHGFAKPLAKSSTSLHQACAEFWLGKG